MPKKSDKTPLNTAPRRGMTITVDTAPAKREPAPKVDLSILTDDAKAILGCWFAMMPTHTTNGLQFGMRELKPTARTRAALAELIEKKIIFRVMDSSVPPPPTEVYKPLFDCFEAFDWTREILEDTDHPERAAAVSWKLMEPVA
ncbi:hypothetical protein BAJUN_01280 [Bajunvirus bajun]|uniref:Uncharacterized protein n=1 Tax=Brevundimonas phage vB_BgoS-Bajun TaxID=2948594 RepID=A0A9E7N6P9_9CAUD|nr:hypothetical protein BAJUN_01280 [Brevundimonas phage vB_BgoS-Bajun]